MAPAATLNAFATAMSKHGNNAGLNLKGDSCKDKSLIQSQGITATASTDPKLTPINTATHSMTTSDLKAIKSSLKAYRELLPLMHSPENIKEVSEAIKAYERLLAKA